MQHFIGETTVLQLPFVKTVVQIAAITLVPVALGLGLHYYAPRFAATVEKWVKGLSLAFLALIIAGVLMQERANLPSFFVQVGWVTLSLNVLTMVLGYGLSILARLDGRSAKAITVEVGIQNGTLAIAIASAPTFLNTPGMAIPAAIYSLVMFATSAVFAGCVRHRQVELIP
jgi:BASS family bile acid:Na+ symporter